MVIQVYKIYYIHMMCIYIYMYTMYVYKPEEAV